MSSCTNRFAISNNFFSLICRQPRDKQNRPRDFLLFKHFLNNLLLTVFMQNTLSKLVELLQLKTYSLLGKTRAPFCASVFRNVWAKFKVDRLTGFVLELVKCSPPEAVAQTYSAKKVFLEILQYLQENTCARVSILIKLQAFSLQLY